MKPTGRHEASEDPGRVRDTALDYVSSLAQHGIKLGLDNIRILCEALGHPERTFESIIVAGTNGKGSVVSMIETALRTAGLRTGSFTSPHLTELAERFGIGGRPVEHDQLVDAATALHATVATLLASHRLAAPPTFFETTTALAFMLFRRAGVQVAVLEVGMGGRFDATNVVEPVAAVITNIDLDHQEFLGQTLPEIAFEKAGVIKPGAVVVTGETKPAALDVLRRVCDGHGVTLIEALSDVETTTMTTQGVTELSLITPHGSYRRVPLSLRGRHQVDNAIIAVRLLENLPTASIPPQAIRAALGHTDWPGRLELVRRPRPSDPLSGDQWVVFDAAHNVAAAKALNSYLVDIYPGGVPLVLAVMRDKNAAGMLTALTPSVTHVVCTEVANARARPADSLAVLAAEHCPNAVVTVVAPPIAALEAAWEIGDMACAAGSIYLVGELRRLTTATHVLSAR